MLPHFRQLPASTGAHSTPSRRVWAIAQFPVFAMSSSPERSPSRAAASANGCAPSGYTMSMRGKAAGQTPGPTTLLPGVRPTRSEGTMNTAGNTSATAAAALALLTFSSAGIAQATEPNYFYNSDNSMQVSYG